MKALYRNAIACRSWAVGVLLSLALARSSHAQTPSLYIAPGAMFCQSGDIYSSGTIQNTGTYVPISGTLRLNKGDFTNTGTISSGSFITTTLSLEENAGATGRTITLGGQALPNLTLNVPGNTTLGNSGAVSGIVNLVAGHLLTSPSPSADYSLTLGATGTLAGETDAHYVKGRVAQARNLSGNAAVDFGNMGVTVNPAGNSFPLTIERRAGLVRAGVSYGVNPHMASYQGIDRIWAFSSTTYTTPSATITLSWLPADDHGLDFGRDRAQVWRSDDFGSTWARQGSEQNGSSRTVTTTITKLTSLYTVSTVVAPLPVELVAFTATKQGADGLVRWQTASEHNSKLFELQASTDGASWLAVGQRTSAGSSATAHSYEFLDKTLARYAAPLIYYRLRCVDLDDSQVFSPVVTLSAEASSAPMWELTAYPNPFALELTAQLTTAEAGPVSLTLLDAAGRLVLRRTLATAQPGTQVLPLDEARTFAPGAYTLLVRQNAHQASLRLIRK